MSAHEGVRLLLVDDDAANRMTCTALLEDEGFQVMECESQAEARLALEARPESFHVVLLDRHLGDGDGAELIPLVRKTQSRGKIVVSSGETFTIESAAADGYHQKGEAFPELLSLLDRLLGFEPVP